MFTTAACIQLVGVIFYGIFASGELQSWAEPRTDEQEALSSNNSLQRNTKITPSDAD